MVGGSLCYHVTLSMVTAHRNAPKVCAILCPYALQENLVIRHLLCVQRFKYYLILSKKLGGRQYSHYFTDDNTEACSSSHGLWGSSQVSNTSLLDLKLYTHSTDADCFLDTLLSWRACPDFPEGDRHVGRGDEERCVRAVDILCFPLNPIGILNLIFWIFFQLHGQSQCPWLNVTTSHFEQGRGLGDPKPWSQPPLPLEDLNWIKILNYMELALAHVDTMQGDLISLLLV